jgi:hypothetical protein
MRVTSHEQALEYAGKLKDLVAIIKEERENNAKVANTAGDRAGFADRERRSLRRRWPKWSRRSWKLKTLLLWQRTGC